MQTLSEINLEQLYSLGDEIEKNCESEFHASLKYGHTNSQLYYALFEGDCQCCSVGVEIRCDGFLSDCEAYYAEGYTCFTCPACDEVWNVTRLEPVK